VAKKPTLTSIAEQISKHLQRFEGDPATNPISQEYKTTPYYMARAWRGGAYVQIRYISYQCVTSIKRAEAEEYLDWLDAGNVGKHFEFRRAITEGIV
jgi:hypothetical protein